jgi:hypothetical protein
MSCSSELTTGGSSVVMSRNVSQQSPSPSGTPIAEDAARPAAESRISPSKRSFYDGHHLGGDHSHLPGGFGRVGVLARPRRFFLGLSAIGPPQLIEPLLLEESRSWRVATATFILAFRPSLTSASGLILPSEIHCETRLGETFWSAANWLFETTSPDVAASTSPSVT